LLDTQQKVEEANIPVILLIAGVDGAGKGDLIGCLNEWFDPRYMQTHAFAEPSQDERERPPHWRYWMTLPPRGRIAIYAVGWYGPALADRIHKRIGNAKFDKELAQIAKLEKTLIDDGAIVLKYWLHLSKKQQEKNLEKLQDNPETRWRVTAIDRKHLKLYDKFKVIAESAIRRTSTAEAPWTLINAYDPHHRRLTAARHIINTLTGRLENDASQLALVNSNRPIVPERDIPAKIHLLRSLRTDLRIHKSAYQKQSAQLFFRLSLATRQARQQQRSAILLFEGWDASGKGGVIRRVTGALDARIYRVIPIAAPTDEEKAHHYLWRFWRHLPRAGNVTIYDRSWYGRVLVERVENFAQPDAWARAYSEINDFEEELTHNGIILLKFWMHIDKDEQLRRFKERENTSYKRYKITPDDYRNRDKWDQYEMAVDEMVSRTSTEYAPWHLIEANDKYYGRIKVLKTICDAYARVLSQ
jgi:polyphosphate:AMP phosphotransferase